MRAALASSSSRVLSAHVFDVGVQPGVARAHLFQPRLLAAQLPLQLDTPLTQGMQRRLALLAGGFERFQLRGAVVLQLFQFAEARGHLGHVSRQFADFLLAGQHARLLVAVAHHAQPVVPQPHAIAGDDGFARAQAWPQRQRLRQIVGDLDAC